MTAKMAAFYPGKMAIFGTFFGTFSVFTCYFSRGTTRATTPDPPVRKNKKKKRNGEFAQGPRAPEYPARRWTLLNNSGIGPTVERTF